MLIIRELGWKDIKNTSRLIRDNFSPEEGYSSVFHFILSVIPIKNVAFHELKYFVAVLNSKVVGVTGIYSYKHHPTNTVWLGWTAVDVKTRGQGVGHTILEHIINYLKIHKFYHICIETTSHEDQIEAIKLYKKFNFVESGRIKNYFNNSDMIIMSRQL